MPEGVAEREWSLTSHMVLFLHRQLSLTSTQSLQQWKKRKKEMVDTLAVTEHEKLGQYEVSFPNQMHILLDRKHPSVGLSTGVLGQ